MLQVGSDKQRVLNVGLGIELSVFDEELAYDSSAPHGIAYLIAHLSYLKGLGQVHSAGWFR